MKTNGKHTRRSTEKAHEEEDTSLLRLFQSVGKGLLAFCASGAVLLVGFSLIAYFGGDPSPMIRPLGVAALGAASLVGGFAAARSHGRAAFLCGILLGGVTAALTFLFSLFFPALRSNDAGWLSALLRFSVPVFTLIGAFLASRKRAPKKHAKRRR